MAFSDDLIVDDAYIAAVSGNLRSLYEALGSRFSNIPVSYGRSEIMRFPKAIRMRRSQHFAR